MTDQRPTGDPPTPEKPESRVGSLGCGALAVLVFGGLGIWSFSPVVREMRRLGRLEREGIVITGHKLDVREVRGITGRPESYRVHYSFTRPSAKQPRQAEVKDISELNEEELRRMVAERMLENSILGTEQGSDTVSWRVFTTIETRRRIPITIHPDDNDLHTAGIVDSDRVQGVIWWKFPYVILGVAMLFLAVCIPASVLRANRKDAASKDGTGRTKQPAKEPE